MNVPTSTALRAPIETREHREERALLGRDLHVRYAAELRRLLDERLLDVVGRCAVRDQVRVCVFRQEKALGHGALPGAPAPPTP